jgi:hypothetical protein
MKMIHRNTGLLIGALKKAGLKFALCVEDNPGHRFMAEEAVARTGRRQGRGLVLPGPEQNWLNDPAYVRLSDRAVLFLFGPQFLAEAERPAIRSTLKSNPLTFALPHLSRRPGMDGAFAWVPVSEGKYRRRSVMERRACGALPTRTQGRPPLRSRGFPGLS